jgi:phosphonatase-like hydrolase
MARSTPDLVVFDLAGTTIEDHDIVGRALVAAAASVDVSITPDEARSVMGLSKPIAIAHLIAKAEGREPAAERIGRAAGAFEQTILTHYAAPRAIVPVAGAAEVFEELRRRGAMIAIDTGFSAVVADAVLDRLGWLADGLVDLRVTSDEVPRGRPAPDMIYEAMRRCAIADARSVAKVGDTPADLREGENAGCGWVVGVTYGTHPREALEPFPHTALIDDLAELTDVLSASRRSGRQLKTGATGRWARDTRKSMA